MGTSQKPWLVWVIFLVARVGSGLENFPLKYQIFQFFTVRFIKDPSVWLKKYSGQKCVCLSFTACQKYALAVLGQCTCLLGLWPNG